MHLVFWQPIPSFHQEAFLCALARADWVDSVALRVESDLPASFQREGWPVPAFPGVDVAGIRADAPPEDSAAHVHFFTGFYTHKRVWRAFERLPERRAAVCFAYAECPALFDWRAPVRRIKYRIHAGLLARRLDGVLAVGERGVAFFESILRGRLPVHSFAYYDCAEADFPEPAPPTRSERVKLLYVGRLIPLKGLDRLFHTLAALPPDAPAWRLTLLGDGPEHAPLRRLARRLGIDARLRWHPAVPAADVAAHYRDSHYLIQPSRGDGWGMTVPEALRHGCEVIVSEACGAADLAPPEFRLPHDESAWPQILNAALASGPPGETVRRATRRRAATVSAEAGVERLRQILKARNQGHG